jgi:hypothetical protein
MSRLRRLAALVAAILVLAVPARAQITGSLNKAHYLSAGSTNQTNVKASAGTLVCIFATNNTGTAYYLHIFDKATAPVAGTDTPVMTIQIAGDGDVHGFCISNGVAMTSGIGFTFTSGIADNDSGNAATGAVINLAYQ